MKNISVLSAVTALMCNQAWGLQAQQALTEEEEEAWKEYWNEVKDDYTFGDEDGEYDWTCTRRVENKYWYAINVQCPTLSEDRQDKCEGNQLEKFEEAIEVCINEELPTSCADLDLTELELSNLRTYNTKRIFQHN